MRADLCRARARTERIARWHAAAADLLAAAWAARPGADRGACAEVAAAAVAMFDAGARDAEVAAFLAREEAWRFGPPASAPARRLALAAALHYAAAAAAESRPSA